MYFVINIFVEYIFLFPKIAFKKKNYQIFLYIKNNEKQTNMN